MSFFHDSDNEPPRVAPLLAATLTDKDKAAELEEEFKWICEWLVKQKIRATRVEHRNYANGGESYLVYFEKPIIDWRDFREKSSMTFTAFGDNHRRHFGDERARAMAYAAYTASHIGTEQPRRFGVGPLKSNGFMGIYPESFGSTRTCMSLSTTPMLITLARLSRLDRCFVGTQLWLVTMTPIHIADALDIHQMLKVAHSLAEK